MKNDVCKMSTSNVGTWYWAARSEESLVTWAEAERWALNPVACECGVEAPQRNLVQLRRAGIAKHTLTAVLSVIGVMLIAIVAAGFAATSRTAPMEKAAPSREVVAVKQSQPVMIRFSPHRVEAGYGLSAGRIVKWLSQPGARVFAGQILARLEGGQTLTANHDGVLVDQLAANGDTIAPRAEGGSPAYTIGLTTELTAEVAADATLAKLQPGWQFNGVTERFPREVFPARVQRITHDGSQTVLHLTLQNRDERLSPHDAITINAPLTPVSDNSATNAVAGN